jgi:hypothetical protein
MSGYTYDDITVDIETGKPISSSERRWYGSGTGRYWFAAVCCIVVFFVLLLLLFFLPYNYYWNDTNNHMYQIEQQMKSQSTPYSSQGLYSLGRALSTKTEYDLCLSTNALYHLVVGSDPVVMNKTDTSRYGESQSTKHYIIRNQFNLRYNVAPDKLGYDTKKLGIRKDEKYIVLHYEIASAYTQFSSVRFVESAYDVYKKMVLPRRIVTICSNDPMGSTRKCSLTQGDIMIMNNTRIIYMDQPNLPPINGRNRTVVPNNVDTNDGEDDIVEDANEDVDNNEIIDSTNALMNDISHIRLYHVLFYKEYIANDSIASYGEYVALSIQPTRC